MEREYSVIGTSLVRVDGKAKVTGEAVYANDLDLPGQVYAGCVLSRYPHAEALVHAEEAAKLPGVVCVLTEKDFPKPRSLYDACYCTAHPGYEGDVVAVVAARSKEQLEDAIRQVKVDYRVLSVVPEIEDALKEDSTTVRDIGVGLDGKGCPDPSRKGNVFYESWRPLRKGDVGKGFEKADVCVSGSYRTEYVEHAYIEPESVLVGMDILKQRYLVFSCSQQGHIPQEFVADALQIPMNRVRAISCTVGGSFGSKFELVGLMCGRAALVVKKTGLPCKMTLSREESILESTKRHPFHTKVRIGAGKDGTITAYKAFQVENAGSCNNQAPWMNIRAMVHSAGPYRIDNIETDTYAVFTNSPYPGAFRGYSSPQVIFGNEMAVYELALALGMSPAKLKRKNLLRRGDLTATGQKLVHETRLAEMMDDIVKETGYEEKFTAYSKAAETVTFPPDGESNFPWQKGIGLVTSYRGCALGGEGVDASGASLTGFSDGSFLLRASLMEIGQGLQTVYTQIAAQASGISPGDIRMDGVDTDKDPDSGLTVASRGTAQGGQSVRIAGEKMRQMLTETAASLLGISQDRVKIEGSRVFEAGKPDHSVSMKEILTSRKYAGLPMTAHAWYRPRDLVNDKKTGQGEAFTTYTYGCCVLEARVNVLTGQVKVDKVTAYHDLGRALNPSLVKGQIYGGIMMGLGFGIWEDLNVKGGRIRSLNLDTYRIATALDMPDIDIRLYESDDPEGTYGAKSIAEAANEMAGAAAALAVSNALGKVVRRLPVTPEKVLKLLDEGNDPGR